MKVQPHAAKENIGNAAVPPCKKFQPYTDKENFENAAVSPCKKVAPLTAKENIGNVAVLPPCKKVQPHAGKANILNVAVLPPCKKVQPAARALGVPRVVAPPSTKLRECRSQDSVDGTTEAPTGTTTPFSCSDCASYAVPPGAQPPPSAQLYFIGTPPRAAPAFAQPAAAAPPTRGPADLTRYQPERVTPASSRRGSSQGTGGSRTPSTPSSSLWGSGLRAVTTPGRLRRSGSQPRLRVPPALRVP